MKRVLVVATVVVALFGISLAWQPAVLGADDGKPVAHDIEGGNLTLDVAIDATTFKLQRETAVLPTNLMRDDTFITDGLIYPGGTIASGSTAFPPTNVQPIGKWVCRGVFQIGSA